jgi:Flp pilus assembly protein TadG
MPFTHQHHRARSVPACRPSTVPGAVGWLRARWRRTAARPDRGAATAELVIAMPLVLLILMFIIQAGVWMHATHVAQAAATRAASAAAAYNSSTAAGQTAGEQTLTAVGGGVLVGATVTVTRTATQVRVEIHATAETVVPGVHWPVTAVVVRPVERFVNPGATS